MDIREQNRVNVEYSHIVLFCTRTLAYHIVKQRENFIRVLYCGSYVKLPLIKTHAV